MERLTKPFNGGYLFNMPYIGDIKAQEEYIDKLSIKLGQYEDAEEQGKLFCLPIGIGQYCYVIEKCKCGLHYKCNNKKAEAKKRSVIVMPLKEDEMGRSCVKVFERHFRVEYLKLIGKTVFKTKEEAEQKLAEMKEE